MSQKFLKLLNGSIVNTEQLLVVAHTGVAQYALVFKGSNQGIQITAEDADKLEAFLEPHVIGVQAEQQPTIEIPASS